MYYKKRGNRFRAPRLLTFAWGAGKFLRGGLGGVRKKTEQQQQQQEQQQWNNQKQTSSSADEGGEEKDEAEVMSVY